MSLIITLTKNKILERHVPHVELSVHTWNQLRMIMNEKLLTHKPTHRVALRDKGINSVMGLQKQYDEPKLINTLRPLRTSSSRRNPVRL